VGRVPEVYTGWRPRRGRGHELPRGAGRFDGWAFKLDQSGELLWEKTFGGTKKDRFDCVTVLSDGSLVISGDGTPEDREQLDAWIIKLSAEGELIWERHYGGEGRDEARFIDALSDGGFAVAGLTTSKGAGDEDAWILRLDAEGKLLWDTVVGGARLDRALELRELADGSIVFVGLTHEERDEFPDGLHACVAMQGGHGRRECLHCFDLPPSTEIYTCKFKRCRHEDTPGDAHSLTFSCFRRQKFLTAERTRRWMIDPINGAGRK